MATTTACAAPLDFDTLVGYWLGEVPEPREATIEEHLFGCGHCSGRLAGVVRLASGIAATVTAGKVSLVVSAPFVEAMKQAGLILREYRLAPGGSVNCTIGSDDDAVISRLRAPLTEVTRLDVVNTLIGHDAPDVRLADVPFDARTGEVLLIPSPAWLKAMPAFTMRTRLLAVSEAGDRPVAEYTFHHSRS